MRPDLLALLPQRASLGLSRLFAAFRLPLLSAVLATVGLFSSGSAGSAAPAANSARADTGALPVNQAIYQYLISEIALQRGEGAAAAHSLFTLAERSRDVRVVRRAAEAAFQAKSWDYARRAVLLWIMLEPTAVAPRQGLVALLQNVSAQEGVVESLMLERALARLRTWLDDPHSSKYHSTLLGEVPGLLSRFDERSTALRAVREWKLPASLRADQLYAVAGLALAANDLADAKLAIEQAILVRRAWPAAVILQAQILRQSGAEGANDAANALLAGYLRDHDVNEVRLAYARGLVADKSFLSAREQFRLVVKRAPEDVESIYAIALISQQIEDFKDAEAQYRRVLALQPRDPNPVMFNLASALEARKAVGEAIEWYQKVGAGDYYVPSQLRAATLVAQRDGLPAARQLLRTAREVAGGSSEVGRQLAIAEVQLLREQKAFDQAEAALSQMLEADPLRPDLLYDRAMVAERMGKLETMEADLRRAIALKPDHAHAYNALGYTFAERGIRLPEAEALILKALELLPNDAFVLDSLGWLRFKQGRVQEAKELLRKAYTARPDAEIAAHLFEVLWASGERDEAQKFIAAARLRFPDSEALSAAAKRIAP